MFIGCGMFRFMAASAFCLVVPTVGLLAADLDYVTQIKPILESRCYACHGALKQEAELRLDTGISVRRGSENGPVLSVEAPADSTLIERITASDDSIRMPPLGMPLAAEEVALIQEWITAGAPSPPDEVPEADPREHWAFRPVERPALPSITNPAWPRNAIDVFLHAAYDAHDLSPATDATPAQRLRRVYLDLIGLPPTADQLQDYLRDPTDRNYKSIVDQLLESPHYGERWGRHWMDVWRYSDWYGRRNINDVRNSAPQIWRWRDWIVDSLNNDKSYGRMVQEMIAADEIAPEDDSAWPATGYLIRNYYSLNPNEWMRHNVEYTGKAFLGLTFNCAHCHDHKYDPIAHDDYFRMRAFFEPIGIRQDRVVGEIEPPPFQPYVYGGSRKVVREGLVRVFDERPDAATWFYTDGDERNKQKQLGSIPPGVPSFLGLALEEIKPIRLPMPGWYPGSRPHLQQSMIEELEAAVASAETKYEQVLANPADTAPQQLAVDDAQRSFDAALAAAVAKGETGSLAGKQSLLLDAVQGRRIIQNTLPGLSAVPANTTIAFQLNILTDNHINFQLARDAEKHLTALYLGFVGGRIKAYRPGGFSEFEIGTYQFGSGQKHFDITLRLQPEQDVALVSVLLHGSDVYLVQDQAIALNGWNPAKNPHQPFTFDCRPGTEVLLDEVAMVAGEQSFAWGFEEPTFADGEDIDGIRGWLVHPLSVAPATSLVSSVAGCESARAAYEQLSQAKAALRAVSREGLAATQQLDAARLQLASTIATIAADNARRDGAGTAQSNELARAAYKKQLAASIVVAKSRILHAEREVARTQALPDNEKERQKKIDAAAKELTAAKQELQAALAKQSSAPESTDYTLLSPTTAPQSSGRRAALARWITDPRNPLTPRVAINHLWMRHFHVPLVESVYDFGRNGQSPSHPRLLDWLTVELLENDWSMKHIHRLMVTSRAYGMSSSSVGLEENLSIDEDNRQLWRMHQGRMEAEVVRDSALFIAGDLEPKVGGPVLPNTQAMTTNRRSIYYEVYPEDGGHDALVDIFDAPDPTECFRRTNTIIPQQALAMSNSAIIHRCSKQAASRISNRVGGASGDEAFVTASFIGVLSRPPLTQEVEAAERFLRKQREIVDDELAVRESFVRVLFNHNDFVTIR